MSNKNKIINQAQKFIQKGQWDKAIKELQKLVAEDPSDVRTLLKLGDVFAKKGERDSATKVYKQVAESYGEQGFFLKAVAVYKQILKHDPKNLEVTLKLAELYEHLGLTSEAMAQYQMASQIHDEAGHSKAALDVLKRMVELDADNVASRIKLAESYSRENAIPEAVQEFQRAADILKKQNRMDDYIKVAERLVYHDPNRFEVIKELATIYLKRNDTKRGLAKLQLCFKAQPKDIEVLTLLAQAFRDLGQLQKTLFVYRELAHIYQETGRDLDARTVLQKILEIDPSDADAREQLGLGTHTGAMSAMTSATSSQPAPSTLGLGTNTMALPFGMTGAMSLMPSPLTGPSGGHASPGGTPGPHLAVQLIGQPSMSLAGQAHELDAAEFGSAEEVGFFASTNVLNVPASSHQGFGENTNSLMAQLARPPGAPLPPPPPFADPYGRQRMMTPAPAPSPPSPLAAPPASSGSGVNIDFGGDSDSNAFFPGGAPPAAADNPAGMGAGQVPPPSISSSGSGGAGPTGAGSRPDHAQIAKILTETDVFIKYGLREKALEHLRHIFDLDPDSVLAHTKMRDIYLGIGDIARAAEAVAQLLQIHTRRGEAELAGAARAELESLAPGHPIISGAPASGDWLGQRTGSEEISIDIVDEHSGEHPVDRQEEVPGFEEDIGEESGIAVSFGGPEEASEAAEPPAAPDPLDAWLGGEDAGVDADPGALGDPGGHGSAAPAVEAEIDPFADDDAPVETVDDREIELAEADAFSQDPEPSRPPAAAEPPPGISDPAEYGQFQRPAQRAPAHAADPAAGLLEPSSAFEEAFGAHFDFAREDSVVSVGDGDILGAADPRPGETAHDLESTGRIDVLRAAQPARGQEDLPPAPLGAAMALELSAEEATTHGRARAEQRRALEEDLAVPGPAKAGRPSLNGSLSAPSGFGDDAEVPEPQTVTFDNPMEREVRRPLARATTEVTPPPFLARDPRAGVSQPDAPLDNTFAEPEPERHPMPRVESRPPAVDPAMADDLFLGTEAPTPPPSHLLETEEEDELPEVSSSAVELQAPAAADDQTHIVTGDQPPADVSDEEPTGEHVIHNQPIEDELDEAEFLFGEGLVDEAREIVSGVLERMPGHPRAIALKATLAALPNTTEEDDDGGVPPDQETTQSLRNGQGASASPSIAAPTVADARPDFDTTAGDDTEESIDAPALGEGPADEATQETSAQGPGLFAGSGDLGGDLDSAFGDAQGDGPPEEQPDDHYDQGIAYKELNRIDDAIAHFKKAIRSPTRGVDSLEMLGHCYLAKNDAESAINAFWQALERGAEGSAATNLKYEIGAAYEFATDTVQAITWFRACYADDPDHRDVQNRLRALGVDPEAEAEAEAGPAAHAAETNGSEGQGNGNYAARGNAAPNAAPKKSKISYI